MKSSVKRLIHRRCCSAGVCTLRVSFLVVDLSTQRYEIITPENLEELVLLKNKSQPATDRAIEVFGHGEWCNFHREHVQHGGVFHWCFFLRSHLLERCLLLGAV